jgi:hypothetical protein
MKYIRLTDNNTHWSGPSGQWAIYKDSNSKYELVENGGPEGHYNDAIENFHTQWPFELSKKQLDDWLRWEPSLKVEYFNSKEELILAMA